MTKPYKRFVVVGVLCLVSTYVISARVHAQGKEQAELAKALQGVSVTLEQGLAASEPSGTPISAKFEVEEGKLQLSVYTMKGTQFSEVAVDYKTGRAAKTEPITEGEDLTAAKAQAAAMAKATQTLRAVAERAVKANPAGKPVAKLTLLKGTAFKSVTEKLD
jgi:hypothetical protein